jgi:hypothetical protein
MKRKCLVVYLSSFLCFFFGGTVADIGKFLKIKKEFTLDLFFVTNSINLLPLRPPSDSIQLDL